MVDVGGKDDTKRTATATGHIYINFLAYQLVTQNYPRAHDSVPLNEEQRKGVTKAGRKGDALTVAQLAAIMGAKQTSNLIPLCHPLALSKIEVTLTPCAVRVPPDTAGAPQPRYMIKCSATVACEGKTGVEMEALTAVSVGLLTVWDMLKAVAGQEMEIGEIKVTEKTGGKSGGFQRA